ncbi:hypothetical protein DQ04_15521000 [Trypanosoma grayi]|uniref:hypothetical protein n=1 Tax=Trypanosoma grayi TaxID=71804 RepID=UPI0004F483C6|nr:hypothetical protein DQ04_15521000 [Trypanosoma grayi]KEG06171.1 hypothetical protein DQ04_15521000 [Trypanosoma grayi]
MPEDEEMDANNEEALRDDDGEVDEAAVRQLLLRIGVDTDEALAKIWEQKDEALRNKWRAIAAARRRAEEEEEEGESAAQDDDEETAEEEEEEEEE